MEKENANQTEVIGADISAEDVKFMRSAIEKTNTTCEPDWLSMSVVIMWGALCMIGYISIHFFLRNIQYYKWIWPLFYALGFVGACYSFIGLCLSFRNDRKTGFVRKLPKQVIGIWVVILLNGLVWTLMGRFVNNFTFCEPGFLFALLFGLCLSITAILDPDVWYLWSLGAIVIFAGIVLSHFLMNYQYIVLGLTTGPGLIMPAVLEKILYQEKDDE